MFTKDFSAALVQQKKIRIKQKLMKFAVGITVPLVVFVVGNEIYQEQNSMAPNIPLDVKHKEWANEDASSETKAEVTLEPVCEVETGLAYLGWAMNARRQLALLMEIATSRSKWLQVGEYIRFSEVGKEQQGATEWRVTSFSRERVVLNKAECHLTIPLIKQPPQSFRQSVVNKEDS